MMTENKEGMVEKVLGAVMDQAMRTAAKIEKALQGTASSFDAQGTFEMFGNQYRWKVRMAHRKKQSYGGFQNADE